MSAALESRAVALADCGKELERALADARSHWDDSVRSAFDQRYAEPVLLAGRKMASELAELATQLTKAMRELENLA